MLTYYLSYQCSPKAGHENASQYTGMVADLFITAESEEGVEERAQEYLDAKGWLIESFEHAELVSFPSTHDLRFNKLWKDAQINSIAALLSTY